MIRYCILENCHRVYSTRGLCRMHYQRAKRAGQPLPFMPWQQKRGKIYRPPPPAIDILEREIWRAIHSWPVRNSSRTDEHLRRALGALGEEAA